MQPSSRSAGRLARRLRSRQSSFDRVSRRHAHDDHSKHGHHGHGVNEPIGRGFWIGLGVIPFSFAVYKFSRSGADGEQPMMTRLIESWSTLREDWERRNTLHTKMVEQAAFDRNLFHSSQGSKMIELRFPEAFNVGSAINVPAGHYSNIDHVVEHYRQKNREQAEKTAKRLTEGKQID